MPGNGLAFHPDLYHAQGKPPPHLRLAIRPHGFRPFQVQGDRQNEIGLWHHTARQAERMIRDYCRRNHCTAFVRVFTPQAELWREEWISVQGRATFHRPTDEHFAGD